jgi:threonine/homoserine/homoserine lactone efflux protein
MPHDHTPSTLALFLAASLVLAVTPGPSVIYLVTRTLRQGRGAGFASIGGIALGNLGNAAIASFGVAVVFSVSALAFTWVKLAGAAYLVYLGIQALRGTSADRGHAPPGSAAHGVATTHARSTANARAMRDGFWVALLNPKTALFFAAFLPQFVDPARPALLQSLMLSAGFVLIAACTDSMYVAAAGRFGPKLSGLGAAPAFGRYMSGCAFIGLGIFVALTGQRK